MLEWKLKRNVFLMVFILCLGITKNSNLFASQKMTDSNSQDALNKKWIGLGLIKGNENGELNLESYLTRAEFIAFVNRLYNFNEKSEEISNYIDVEENKWYYDDISKGIAAGYIKGKSKNTIEPNAYITHEEVISIVSRISNWIQATTKFVNTNDKISDWAKESIETSIFNGFIMEEHEGLDYTSYIKRGEVILYLDKIYENERVYSLKGEYGFNEKVQEASKVLINSSNISLQNTIISDSLTITKNPINANIKLKNIIVKNKALISSVNSILIENSDIEQLIIKENNNKVVISKSSNIPILKIECSDTNIEIKENTKIDKIIITGTNNTINISQNVIIRQADISAVNNNIFLDVECIIDEIRVNLPTSVTGNGTINTAYINVEGSFFEKMPIKIIKLINIENKHDTYQADLSNNNSYNNNNQNNESNKITVIQVKGIYDEYVSFGTQIYNINLPKKAIAVLSNNENINVNIEWKNLESYNPYNPSTYTFEGELKEENSEDSLPEKSFINKKVVVDSKKEMITTPSALVLTATPLTINKDTSSHLEAIVYDEYGNKLNSEINAVWEVEGQPKGVNLLSNFDNAHITVDEIVEYSTISVRCTFENLEDSVIINIEKNLDNGKDNDLDNDNSLDNDGSLDNDDGNDFDESVSIWNGSTEQSFKYGNGTKENPYIIASAAQLAGLAKTINEASQDNTQFDGKYFKLATNIDLNNIPWTSIGTETNPFKGSFDGGGFEITNMKVDDSLNSSNLGLFGVVDSKDGEIIFNNIKLINALIELSPENRVNTIGGIVAKIENNINVEITNCTILNLEIYAYNYNEDLVNTHVGGLVGFSKNNEKTLFKNNNININIYTDFNYVGGIAGYIEGEDIKIESCKNIGNIKGTNYVGGLVGLFISDNFEMNNCNNNGNLDVNPIYGNISFAVGGLIGSGERSNPNESQSSITISKSYNFGKINTANSKFVGGLIGYSFSNIYFCSNFGDIYSEVNIYTTEDEVFNLGGIAGINNGKILQCSLESKEIISKGLQNIGGIAGINKGFIEGCLNKSYIEAEAKNNHNNAGGISGINYRDILNCENNGELATKSLLNTNNDGYIGFNVGGITGKNISLASILNSKNLQTISSQNVSIVGGVVGENHGLIKETSNQKDIIISDLELIENYNQGESVGGIVGKNFRTIESSFNIGNINIITAASGVSNRELWTSSGGIAGYNINIISNCYSKSNISLKNQSSSYPNITSTGGGIIGINYGTVINCYFVGNVESSVMSGSSIGALLGFNNGIISSCFYVTDETLNMIGSESTGSDVDSCSTKEEFDFSNKFNNDIWEFTDTEYPVLKNNPE